MACLVYELIFSFLFFFLQKTHIFNSDTFAIKADEKSTIFFLILCVCHICALEKKYTYIRQLVANVLIDECIKM